jgi:hypothetical protein
MQNQCIIFVRVSTVEQAATGHFSLAAQEILCPSGFFVGFRELPLEDRRRSNASSETNLNSPFPNQVSAFEEIQLPQQDRLHAENRTPHQILPTLRIF